VNANPSGSRTPSTGGWGRLQARRELAAATEPSPSVAQCDVHAGNSGGTLLGANGSNGGTRHAKTVCRGALNLRRAAQGRVGEQSSPRHIARHPESHRLLSANTSAFADADRPRQSGGASHRPAMVSTTPHAAFRPQAQPADGRWPREEARQSEPVDPGRGVVATSACVHTRGKGVLAA
jgi:hypothetical protein